MDYSLLVGVHDLDRAEQEALEAGDDDECDENGAPGTESEEEVGDDDECDENGVPGTESEDEVCCSLTHTPAACHCRTY